jgi:hypothetical protein
MQTHKHTQANTCLQAYTLALTYTHACKSLNRSTQWFQTKKWTQNENINTLTWSWTWNSFRCQHQHSTLSLSFSVFFWSLFESVQDVSPMVCAEIDPRFLLSLVNDSLEGKMAVDPLKNKRCWIKAQIFAQRASSGAAGMKVLTGKSGLTHFLSCQFISFSFWTLLLNFCSQPLCYALFLFNHSLNLGKLYRQRWVRKFEPQCHPNFGSPESVSQQR